MTSPGRMLKRARLAAGLSQRELAARARVPQSTVARIESGVIDPRATMLGRLLAACGYALVPEPSGGAGVDRSLLRRQLELPPRARIESMARAAAAVGRLRGAARGA